MLRSRSISGPAKRAGSHIRNHGISLCGRSSTPISTIDARRDRAWRKRTLPRLLTWASPSFDTTLGGMSTGWTETEAGRCPDVEDRVVRDAVIPLLACRAGRSRKVPGRAPLGPNPSIPPLRTSAPVSRNDHKHLTCDKGGSGLHKLSTGVHAVWSRSARFSPNSHSRWHCSHLLYRQLPGWP